MTSLHEDLRQAGAACNPDIEGEKAFQTQFHSLKDIYDHFGRSVPEGQRGRYEGMVVALSKDLPTSDQALNNKLLQLSRGSKDGIPKKCDLLQVYEDLVARSVIQKSELRQRLVSKAMKSQSGVVSITVVTSPYPVGDDGVTKQAFSCKYDCFYCPNQPGQPRSYLRDEPAVLRANQNQFDPALQFTERAMSLSTNGHPVDKIEVLVLGGTWSNYPKVYQESFIRDIFYAANTFRMDPDTLPPKQGLLAEQTRNETATCKVIGLTLETRPDTIDAAEIVSMREMGCTRVQIGVQHVDDGILQKVNRGHSAADSVAAIKLLKDSCFKIDIHLMPNLPGSTPDLDKAMFADVFESEDYQADQVKIYPCDTTPFTKIAEWHASGEYIPYSAKDLIDVLVYGKSLVPPWVRLNRVIRDIPAKYITAGPQENLREVVLGEMAAKGVLCKCIRCREAGDMGGRQANRERAPDAKKTQRDGVEAKKRAERLLLNEAELVTRRYESSGAIDYFLSYETPDRTTLFGFCRLRITNDSTLPALHNAGLIRELHVYGQLIHSDDHTGSNAQHTGLGRALLAEAEHISAINGKTSVAVIAGVGSRGYYTKLGYVLDTTPKGGYFVRKELSAGMLKRGVPLSQRRPAQRGVGLVGLLEDVTGRRLTWVYDMLSDAPDAVSWMMGFTMLALSVWGIMTLLHLAEL